MAKPLPLGRLIEPAVIADLCRWIGRSAERALKVERALKAIVAPDWIASFTVHRLRAGRAVCVAKNPFLRRVPGNWPAGHVWSRSQENVNCKVCLERPD